jgi:hypothetical protein
VVRFETQDGKTVEFESGLGTNIPPRVGEEVTVIYDPSRPQEAKVTVGSTLRFRPKMLVVGRVAALFVVLVPFIAFVLLLLWATLWPLPNRPSWGPPWSRAGGSFKMRWYNTRGIPLRSRVI